MSHLISINKLVQFSGATIEFNVNEKEQDRRELSIIAYYDARTFLGKIYWYLCLPFHTFVFRALIEDIDKKAVKI